MILSVLNGNDIMQSALRGMQSCSVKRPAIEISKPDKEHQDSSHKTRFLA